MFASLYLLKTVRKRFKNVNLLFLFHLLGLGRLLYHEHILGCLQVVQFSESVIVEVLQSHVVFKVNLVE